MSKQNVQSIFHLFQSLSMKYTIRWAAIEMLLPMAIVTYSKGHELGERLTLHFVIWSMFGLDQRWYVFLSHLTHYPKMPFEIPGYLRIHRKHFTEHPIMQSKRLQNINDEPIKVKYAGGNQRCFPSFYEKCTLQTKTKIIWGNEQ